MPRAITCEFTFKADNRISGSSRRAISGCQNEFLATSTLSHGASKTYLRRPPAVSHVLEALMHELNRHRAFANGRGDAFDRASAHIPGREHARPARFEQKRLARGSPGSGAC